MNIDEFAVRSDGVEEREPTADEVRQALDADPEGALVADYLTNSLSPEAHAEVERRLREDEAFRARVAPIIDAWNAWPTAHDFTLSERERDASFQQFLVKWDAHQREQGDARGRADPLGRPTGEAGDERVLRRRLRRWQLAAALLALATLGGVPAAAWLGFTTAQRLQPPRTYTVEAAAREAKMVAVSQDVTVSLDPGARLTWSEAPGPNGAHELFLDGAARVEAPYVGVGKYIVTTPSSRLNLNGARVRIDATDPFATRIEVEDGRVVVESRSRTNHPLLELNAGEVGMSQHDQPPRIVR